LDRGWITDRWVMKIAGCMDCGAEEKWEEPNREQGHPPENAFKDNWCPECQENWEAGQWEVSRGRVSQMVTYFVCD